MSVRRFDTIWAERPAVVPGRHVRVTNDVQPVGAPAGQEGDVPRVEVQRDGDVARTINVTCTCGKTIRLRCVYD